MSRIVSCTFVMNVEMENYSRCSMAVVFLFTFGILASEKSHLKEDKNLKKKLIGCLNSDHQRFVVPDKFNGVIKTRNVGNRSESKYDLLLLHLFPAVHDGFDGINKSFCIAWSVAHICCSPFDLFSNQKCSFFTSQYQMVA